MPVRALTDEEWSLWEPAFLDLTRVGAMDIDKQTLLSALRASKVPYLTGLGYWSHTFEPQTTSSTKFTVEVHYDLNQEEDDQFNEPDDGVNASIFGVNLYDEGGAHHWITIKAILVTHDDGLTAGPGQPNHLRYLVATNTSLAHAEGCVKTDGSSPRWNKCYGRMSAAIPCCKHWKGTFDGLCDPNNHRGFSTFETRYKQDIVADDDRVKMNEVILKLMLEVRT